MATGFGNEAATAGQPYCTVVGALNMDIWGQPSKMLSFRDSAPGIVRTSPGGVGRNIANNLALLGEQVSLVTAFGDDSRAAELAAHCAEAGIDVGQALTIPGARTSVYLYINDEQGDMELAINDMEIYQHITPDFLHSKLPFINAGALCVADTNIGQESLERLAAGLTVPLFVDAVSMTKALKLENMLDKIHTLKLNQLEAGALSGVTLGGRESTRAMGRALIEKGVKQVYISMGTEGVYCTDGATGEFLPALPANVVSTTGAGDCMMAAIAWGWRQGLGLLEAGRASQAAASVSIACEAIVNPALSADSVRALMDQ